MSRHASARSLVPVDFTLAQQAARYGLTVLAIAGASALFATLMANTIH